MVCEELIATIDGMYEDTLVLQEISFIRLMNMEKKSLPEAAKRLAVVAFLLQ